MNRPVLDPTQQQAFAELLRINPALRGGLSAASSSITPCSADRVMIAGGQLMSYVTPSSIIPFEVTYRRLPPDGIFTARPNDPTQFEVGSFRVPQSQGLVLLDYRFDIYRPSGIASGDFLPLEQNRLSTQVGWSLKQDSMVQGNYRYELTPINAAQGSASYAQGVSPGLAPPATEAQFEAARASATQSAIGGTSVMPQRHHRQGLMHVPAPWLLHSNQTLNVACHVFRSIQIPIAFFECELFGFLIPDNDLLAIQKAVAPCVSDSR